MESDAKLREEPVLKTEVVYVDNKDKTLSDDEMKGDNDWASDTSTKTKEDSSAEKVETGRKQYSCEECNKVFKNRYYFEVHNSKHTGVKPYACEVCNKGFTMRWVLKIHSRIHTGEEVVSWVFLRFGMVFFRCETVFV